MHAEYRYTPTSPLSPKLQSNNRPLSPQPASKPRSGHARQTARSLQMSLPRYHPMNFANQGSATVPSSSMHNPAITISRATQPVQLESPRTMRERQVKMLAEHLSASREAASPLGAKPTSPRLDPLGSPKGAVTPLTLEEASDYFAVRGAGKSSPAASPGARSSCSDRSVNKEEPVVQHKRKADAFR